MIARLCRPLVMGLLPVALIACMNSPPTSAEPSASVPLGIDLGGSGPVIASVRPELSPDIAPGETFVYRFPVHQSGTYWYHSHSMFQEQTGLYGAIVIAPKAGYAQAFDRDYVVLLSDCSAEPPETIVSNLKFQSDYYNYGQRTLGTFIADAQRVGLADTVADRLEWGKMRMSPTDILDVSGATYTYLINGQPPGANWTALFRPGERVRLRFINGSSMSIFDVRID